jgi:hypothetical protein
MAAVDCRQLRATYSRHEVAGYARVVMTSDKELARKLFREALRAADDEVVADKIYSEEKAVRRKMRDAPIPRPRLKFEVQREGSVLKHRDEIFAMLADMNDRGVPDDVQVASALKRFPDVKKSSLFELIDGTSDCTYPRNRKRLSGQNPR